MDGRSFFAGFAFAYVLLFLLLAVLVWWALRKVEEADRRINAGAPDRPAANDAPAPDRVPSDAIDASRTVLTLRVDTAAAAPTLPLDAPENRTGSEVGSISEAVERSLAPANADSATYGHDAETHTTDDE